MSRNILSSCVRLFAIPCAFSCVFACASPAQAPAQSPTQSPTQSPAENAKAGSPAAEIAPASEPAHADATEPASATAPAAVATPNATGEQTPPGELVCRTAKDGYAEQLYLEWSGDTAKGTLLTSTPSGMVHNEPVRASRYKARIIIDDPDNEDLAVHKATIVQNGSKKAIQMGDWTHGWTPCN